MPTAYDPPANNRTESRPRASARRLWPWLRGLIGIGILVVLGWRLGTEAFVRGLGTIDAQALLAALVIGWLTTICTAIRWQVIAHRLDLPLPLPTAIAGYYRALLLNAVLPAGVLGDVDRGVRHGRLAGNTARGVRAVVLERTAGAVVLVVIAIASLLAHPTLFALTADKLDPSPGLLAVPAGGVACAVAAAIWARYGKNDSRLRSGVAAAFTEARVTMLCRRTCPSVVILSVATVVGHLAMFLVAARTAGVTAPVTQLLPLFLLALLAMGVPTNIGGWGPREAGCALAFGAAGLGASHGVATAVVYGVLALVASLPGALVLLAQAGQRLKIVTNAFTSPRRYQATTQNSTPSTAGNTAPDGLRTASSVVTAPIMTPTRPSAASPASRGTSRPMAPADSTTAVK